MASFKQDLAPVFTCACTEDANGDTHMQGILDISDYKTAKDNSKAIQNRIEDNSMPPQDWVSSSTICSGLQPEYKDHTWGDAKDAARTKLKNDFAAWVKANFPP